jgi:hypothetical protein
VTVPGRIRCLAILAAAALLATVPASVRGARADLLGRASVQPSTVHLGEPARYRGAVVFRRGELARPRWVAPDTAGSLTWGPMATRLGRGAGGIDTLWIDTSVQSFQLGRQTVPGVVFVDEGTVPPAVRHLPGTMLRVVSVLAAADSNAKLHGVRGPLAAPWWERVPWVWVIGGLVLLALIIAMVRALRRRPPVLRPAALAPTDPATVALARLAGLRARGLPARGAFGAHALELTSILRRFLEATAMASRPGQTTTELSAWLRTTPLSASEVEWLTRLMRGWDALKFARGESSPDQARESEAAVEAFVRSHRTPVREEAA